VSDSEPAKPRPTPRLVEVGPRDGLQNEKNTVPLDAKAAFIDALSGTGLHEIEAGAFVNPKAFPQLANSEQVFARIKRPPGVAYSALVSNVVGLELALAVKADKVVVLAAASESFSQRIAKSSIAGAIERLRPVVARARAARLPVRASVSAAFWCPYEGKIDPAKTVEVVKRMSGIGVSEFSVGDTVGKASPDEVRKLLFLLLKAVPKDSVFLSFRNAFGRAVANSIVAWKTFGVAGFESSAGGAGGLVATEALVSAFKAAGADVDVDEEKLKAAAAGLFKHLGRPVGARPAK
jgi:hydroxymethylglutaryl-CoA lyase